MRRFCAAAVLGFLACASVPSFVHADDEVLVPSDNNSSSGTVDLGLMPAPAQDSSSSKPPDYPAPDNDTSLPTIDPGSSSEATPPAAGGHYTLAPPESFSAAAANMAAYSNATRVMKLPAPEPPISTPDNMDKTGQSDNALEIDISDKYVWGNFDDSSLKRGLGLSPEDAHKHCHISVSGTITTDTTAVPIQINPHMMHASVQMSGKPTGITLLTMAMCDVIPLPDNLGMVTQIGDKYSVFLQQVSCKPPPENARRFIFTYTGNGTGKCAYQ